MHFILKFLILGLVTLDRPLLNDNTLLESTPISPFKASKANVDVILETNKPIENTSLKVVSANINLMPPGITAMFTNGDPYKRARQLAKFLLNANNKVDVFVIQELYDQSASEIFIEIFRNAGFEYYPGPDKASYGTAYDSGQAVFVRKPWEVLTYETFAFQDFGTYGSGPLESYLPKGVIFLQLAHPESGASLLDIYAIHLQSDILTFGWGFFKYIIAGEFTLAFKTFDWNRPRKIRFEQLNILKEYMKEKETPSESNPVYKSPKYLIIGDFNISSSKATSSEYTNTLELLGARPVAIAEGHEFDTVGIHTNNTSHFNIAWRIGGWMYETGQLDHALLSKEDTEESDFGVFSIKENDQSLTDHEGIWFEFWL